MSSTLLSLSPRSIPRSLVQRILQHPVRDFLAPSTTCATHQSPRFSSTIAAPQPPPSSQQSRPPLQQQSNGKPIRPLSQEQQEFLSSALRVNQTGELAAILIYAA